MTDKVFLQALQGQNTRSVPFWFMRQAGRYLPEYRELRAKKNGFMDMALDPEAAAEITVQPIRRFGMDAAIIFSDILMIPYGLGMDVDFVPGEGPKLNALNNAENLSTLSADHMDRLEPVYEALRKTRSQLDEEGFENTALIGFAGAPWTVATYMVEGGSSRDFMKTKLWAYENPESFQSLIHKIVEATSAYLIKQIEAGAEALQIFDSWCSVLDHDGFQRWSIAPTKAIVAAVKKAHPNIPIIGFPKGSGVNITDYAEQIGCDAIGLDSQISVEWAAQNLSGKTLQGNLDPFLLRAEGVEMREQAHKILKTFADHPFIFNLGHGINKDTPIAHVEELAKIIKEFER